MSLAEITAGKSVLALDMDGVIVHPLSGLRMWDANIQEDLGIDPKLLSSQFFRTAWADVVSGRQDLKEALGNFLREVGSAVPVEEVVTYWFQHDGQVDRLLVEQVVRWRGNGDHRAVVAVSNQEHYRIQYLMDELQLRDAVDGGLWSCELGTTKSDPEFYAVANREYLPRAKSVVFFDDEPKHVDLATSAGWKSYVYRSLADLASALPTS